MSWQEIRRHMKTLVAVRESDKPFGPSWAEFCDVVRATRERPPYHLAMPLQLAEEAARRRSGSEIRILDHGCGGGSTLLYLLALGFTGIHGVELGRGPEKWNRLLAEEFGITEQRFFSYDGQNLPFANATFDLVLSEEVVEHVRPEAIAKYYSDAARVLRPDGVAYYTVPHRLVPYESHSRTWFIHYLPRTMALSIYGWMDKEHRNWMEKHVFLRWPGFHMHTLAKLYADTKDLTPERLRTLSHFDYYDGPRKLRHILGALARLPILGAVFIALIYPLLMRQTVSRKSLQHLP